MASNVNSSKVPCQGTTTKSPQNQQQSQSSNFEPLDKSSSNTLKRNPKMELSKSDLLKLLSYLEGELQARDIVIATLKMEFAISTMTTLCQMSQNLVAFEEQKVYCGASNFETGQKHSRSNINIRMPFDYTI